MTVGPIIFPVIMIALSLVGGSCSSKKPQKMDEPAFDYACKADREIIATYEYLKRSKELGLKPEDMRKVSLEVSKGCTGAASAFIDIHRMLLKSNIDGKSSIEISRDIAAKGEKFSKSFRSIFRASFAKEYLDLDSGTALRISKKLTSEFKGDPEVASDDYLAIAKYCVGKDGLDLPRPDCASLALRVTGYSEESKLSVADSFRDAIAYLTSKNETNLSTRDALPIAEALIAVSPNAISNFKNLYEYASEKDGLALARADAISYAKAGALNTKQKKSL